MTFSYVHKSHALVVLVAHDLGDGVKDCFVSDQPKAIRSEYLQSAGQHGIAFREYTPEQARVVVADALDREPCPVKPDQVEDVASNIALLRQPLELHHGGGHRHRRSKRRLPASFDGPSRRSIRGLQWRLGLRLPARGAGGPRTPGTRGADGVAGAG